MPCTCPVCLAHGLCYCTFVGATFVARSARVPPSPPQRGEEGGKLLLLALAVDDDTLLPVQLTREKNPSECALVQTASRMANLSCTVTKEHLATVVHTAPLEAVLLFSLPDVCNGLDESDVVGILDAYAPLLWVSSGTPSLSPPLSAVLRNVKTSDFFGTVVELLKNQPCFTPLLPSSPLSHLRENGGKRENGVKNKHTSAASSSIASSAFFSDEDIYQAPDAELFLEPLEEEMYRSAPCAAFPAVLARCH